MTYTYHKIEPIVDEVSVTSYCRASDYLCTRPMLYNLLDIFNARTIVEIMIDQKIRNRKLGKSVPILLQLYSLELSISKVH